MSRQSFWSNEARTALVDSGRQDLVDRGDALAERVAALILISIGRLDRYAEHGDLYSGRGGEDAMYAENPIADLEHFVNERLPEEVAALENLLSTFDDLRLPSIVRPAHEPAPEPISQTRSLRSVGR